MWPSGQLQRQYRYIQESVLRADAHTIYKGYCTALFFGGNHDLSGFFVSRGSSFFLGAFHQSRVSPPYCDVSYVRVITGKRNAIPPLGPPQDKRPSQNADFLRSQPPVYERREHGQPFGHGRFMYTQTFRTTSSHFLLGTRIVRSPTIANQSRGGGTYVRTYVCCHNCSRSLYVRISPVFSSPFQVSGGYMRTRREREREREREKETILESAW